MDSPAVEYIAIHKGNIDNEKTDKIAKQTVGLTLAGPEPTYDIAKESLKDLDQNVGKYNADYKHPWILGVQETNLANRKSNKSFKAN